MDSHENRKERNAVDRWMKKIGDMDTETRQDLH